MSEIITPEHKQAARFARALGHPVRIFILKYLDRQACCYSGDLSEILPIAKSTLSQHLKELKKAGLIQGETEAPRIRYCINRENWDQARKIMQHILGV
jgi:DNA-binding transcriptional ArsR family regulator